MDHMSPEALSEYQGKNVSRHQRIILSQLWGAWRTFSSWRLATYPSMTNSKVVYTISGPTTSRYSTWARICLLGGGQCFGQLVHNNYLFGYWWMRTRLHFCPNILVAYKDIILPWKLLPDYKSNLYLAPWTLIIAWTGMWRTQEMLPSFLLPMPRQSIFKFSWYESHIGQCFGQLVNKSFWLLRLHTSLNIQ